MNTELSMEEVTALLQEAEHLFQEDDSNIFTSSSPEKLLRFRNEAAARADLAREGEPQVAVPPEMALHYG